MSCKRTEATWNQKCCKTIQITILLKRFRIVNRILQHWGDLLLFNLLCKLPDIIGACSQWVNTTTNSNNGFKEDYCNNNSWTWYLCWIRIPSIQEMANELQLYNTSWTGVWRNLSAILCWEEISTEMKKFSDWIKSYAAVLNYKLPDQIWPSSLEWKKPDRKEFQQVVINWNIVDIFIFR